VGDFPKWEYVRPNYAGYYWWQIRIGSLLQAPMMIALVWNDQEQQWLWTANGSDRKFSDEDMKEIESRWSGPIQMPSVWEEWK
jgi:hypothetical protein